MHAEHIAVRAQLLERPQNDPGLEREWITVLLKKSTLSFLKKEISAAVNKNNKYSKQNTLLFILDYKGTKSVEEASS